MIKHNKRTAKKIRIMWLIDKNILIDKLHYSKKKVKINNKALEKGYNIISNTDYTNRKVKRTLYSLTM